VNQCWKDAELESDPTELRSSQEGNFKQLNLQQPTHRTPHTPLKFATMHPQA